MSDLPRIIKSDSGTTFLVDGKPFYMRAGEIHNSSASNRDYMEKAVWPALRGHHLNSLIVPVYWECVEPEEGKFDFTLVDSLLEQARREQVRMELLWFGLWKNSASDYVPQWVKKNPERFWLVRDENGKLPRYFGSPAFIISPLCGEAVAADARAFSRLLAHLKEVDPQHTVIVIQVENEVGILGAKRDHTPAAEQAFPNAVPVALGKEGTWQEAYGDYAEEAFMAWHYACAVHTIAAAGKAELDIPMIVNAWLEQEPWIPGTYPSGGPQFKNIDIWRSAAPEIDAFCPDIYVPYFKMVCAEYTGKGNPLMIPETRTEVGFYLYGVGAHNVLCYSPFGIEDVMDVDAEPDEQTLNLLKISPEVFSAIQKNGMQLFCAYEMVENMEALIAAGHKTRTIHGFLYDGDTKETVELKNTWIEISYSKTEPGNPVGGGFVLELGEYEYLVAGINCSFTFHSKTGDALYTLCKEEGTYRDGIWQPGRILNGDERYFNTFQNEVGMLHLSYQPVQD